MKTHRSSTTKIIIRTTLALALALAALPALASGLDLSLHYGIDKYDAVGLRSGLRNTDFSSSQKLDDASQSVGATIIARLGMLDLGVIGELGRPGKDNTTSVVGALADSTSTSARCGSRRSERWAGTATATPSTNSAVIKDTSRSDWLAYAGVRPGISVRLGGPLFIGVWAFARWDLTSKDVPVTLAGGSGTSTYKLGGSQFGAALRLGISL